MRLASTERKAHHQSLAAELLARKHRLIDASREQMATATEAVEGARVRRLEAALEQKAEMRELKHRASEQEQARQSHELQDAGPKLHAEPWHTGTSPRSALPKISTPRGSDEVREPHHAEASAKPAPCLHSETAASKARSTEIAARPQRVCKQGFASGFARKDIDLFADVFY